MTSLILQGNKRQQHYHLLKIEPIFSLALDGSDRWWQSPTLQYSPAYQYITLTVDLHKMYQVISMKTQ